MKRSVLFLLLLPVCFHARSQETFPARADSVLKEVTVHAYANDRPLSETPAAIGLVTVKTLERFNNTSLLPAMNTIPGVRMEERSPGSYRFAIRGSSLRSPFGIRNVKMYWNGLPLTDGGGNTYLNLMDFNSVTGAEVIKGPGGSLYGAGTGGVVLLNSFSPNQDEATLSAVAGSYGLRRIQSNVRMGTDNVNTSVNYSHQQSDGYREHTAMRRDAINSDSRFRLNSGSTLSTTLFYTDLYYQTPGGLTKVQYDADARQARPTAGTSPGADAQQAAVYNKTLYGGAMYDVQWSDNWSSRIGAFGSSTRFTNPTLRNYEIRREDNFGGRTETQYKFGGTVSGKITLGGEYQHFYSPLTDYDNNGGAQGNLQTDDRLYSTIFVAFAQADLKLPSNFFLTLGGSDNFINYKLSRVSISPQISQYRQFSPVFSPRAALMKKVNEAFSAYATYARGFSPPSLAEVRPSTGNFNSGLNPELGTNYEGGVRGSLHHGLSYDVAAYYFALKNTIVVQQQAGADYFINAGSTLQKGVESMLAWSAPLSAASRVSALRLWGSYTFTHYRFQHYVENNIDNSGKKLTGVAPNTFTGGIDISVRRLYANMTVNYVDKIPLNDANTEYASSYFLLGMRLGYSWDIHHAGSLELFGGVDNAANTRYSLGNDLNATGGRYYNVASGRNFYLGLKLRAAKPHA